ncbi:hypothetical protein GCM10008967_07020 [Bacillus carboniphilus]|uniref:HTH cro/C1-type domain-containing protein n=1 Tax=Bacillus carboniphilus TaxID=86663 RepID=A0ABN0VWH2_9BACI
MDNEKLLSQSIGKNVRALRYKLDKTIEELAWDSKLDATFVGEIERGKVSPSTYTVFKLAVGLELDNPLILLMEGRDEVYPLMKKEEE